MFIPGNGGSRWPWFAWWAARRRTTGASISIATFARSFRTIAFIVTAPTKPNGKADGAEGGALDGYGPKGIDKAELLISTQGWRVAWVVMGLLVALFRFTDLGLRMRASAFNPEVARLLGVNVSRMLTLGWALAALVGSLSGLLIAGGSLVHPGYMDSVVVYGFVAAVLAIVDHRLRGGGSVAVNWRERPYRRPRWERDGAAIRQLQQLFLNPVGVMLDDDQLHVLRGYEAVHLAAR